MNNRQVTTQDLLQIIGRQRVEIELMTRQLEQMQSLAQSEQNRANEAQEVAKKLHQQIQKSAIENNGAEIGRLEKEPD
ncbi:hypothetical protein LCGC14_1233260 [marine sediment metagenome]|uniref:Uncharacterized protein n=1 Tax=marine sediment metagenome TaxID=412755 RepID=A0A0F9L7Z7_9ZZZZ